MMQLTDDQKDILKKVNSYVFKHYFPRGDATIKTEMMLESEELTEKERGLIKLGEVMGVGVSGWYITKDIYKIIDGYGDSVLPTEEELMLDAKFLDRKMKADGFYEYKCETHGNMQTNTPPDEIKQTCPLCKLVEEEFCKCGKLDDDITYKDGMPFLMTMDDRIPINFCCVCGNKLKRKYNDPNNSR